MRNLEEEEEEEEKGERWLAWRRRKTCRGQKLTTMMENGKRATLNSNLSSLKFELTYFDYRWLLREN